MPRDDADTLVLEAPAVASGKKGKAERERARDKGEVKPLGVEIGVSIYDALERCRKAKKWSKRTAVEEALTRWLAEEGFPPEPAAD